MEIILFLLLTLSIIGNVVLIKYSKNITKKLWFISNNIGDLLIETDYFHKHLDLVYNQETYYGDETLAYLLRHVGSYVEQIEKFEEIYSIVNGELEIVADLEKGILEYEGNETFEEEQETIKE